MLVYNIFIQYGLTIIMGVICLTLILVQGKDIISENKTYRALAIFLGITTLSSILAFYLYINDFVFADFTTPLLLRCAMYFLYAIILYAWMVILQNLSIDSGETRPRGIFLAGKAITVVATLFFLFIATFVMNKYADIENYFWFDVYVYLEQIFAALAIIIILLAAIKSLRVIILTTTKNFVKASTALLILNYLFNIALMTPAGYDMLSERIDFGGWITVALDLVILWFIYKNDFQQPFKVQTVPEYGCGTHESGCSGTTEKATVLTAAMVMNKLAEDHRLTNREREILELIYNGASNAQIAEELFISINTVKTHVRNIFEKLGVSSRMELTFLVNGQMTE